jgi:RimJ/RimL family protein N-acetyltransferase
MPTTPAPTVIRHRDADAFLAAAEPALVRDPAARAFYTALAMAPAERVGAFEATRYFATLDSGGVLGVAMQTAPDRQLVLQGCDVAAAPVFADDFAETGRPLRGVVGERPVCEAFLRTWATGHDDRYELWVHMRNHRLTAVADHLPQCAGSMRIADDADARWVVAQQVAFVNEVRIPETPERVERAVLQRIAQRRFRIWDHAGEAVAYAGFSDAGEAGARVGPVWTLPVHRGHGYGTALVAAVARELLARGKQELFLVTDIANPTSNAIYARIGFRPLRDFCEFHKVDSA